MSERKKRKKKSAGHAYEAAVEMRLKRELHHPLVMAVVDVRVDAKEATEDVAAHVAEIGWERDARLRRKDGLVVELVLHPLHQKLHVLLRGCPVETGGR